MAHKSLLISFFMLLNACASTGSESTKANVATNVNKGNAGDHFIELQWREAQGALWMAIDRLDEPLIYQSSLARGIGSNDIGLDRGQLGQTAIVSFVRVGPKVLMIEHNLRYRAPSNNPFEQRAIDESFARSVLWGFDVADDDGDKIWVDATAFVLRDAHGLAETLKAQEHGSFAVDASRSAIYLPRTKAFVDNTEIEGMVTFTGTPAGDILPTVVPDPTAITVHMHHSFVQLPDDQYQPLAYDPRSGFIDTDFYGGFYDYAVPINEPTAQSFARRHRLHKKNPGAALSEPIEPIVYYLDRGAPEPVRQALIDGASWWNDAFTAAGFRNGFVVKMLPEDADPMDVRYNVIQWVHRSTRGWSYGSSVTDPRTGEIIKGHVTLGSLRVRQDYLLAEGLLSPYAEGDDDPAMLEMSLARIRQLSAHEVGHTIGLEHNFAGSVNDRASVMDYPFPRVSLDAAGAVSLDDAYASGIGRWDTRAITWGYGDYSDGGDPVAAREAYLRDTYDSGLLFVADRHARDVGTMHPDGNLWDNGADAVEELQNLLDVRRVALSNMGPATIRRGRPLATIEEAIVPIYLLHRYQIKAVGKLIGGSRFGYGLRGDTQTTMEPVPQNRQQAALSALLATLTPAALSLPDALHRALPPRPPGFGPTRELFSRRTGDQFDALAPADAYVQLCLDVLLNPQRAARLTQAKTVNSRELGFGDLVQQLIDATWTSQRDSGMAGAYQRTVQRTVMLRLAALANHEQADPQVRAIALAHVHDTIKKLENTPTSTDVWSAHGGFVLAQLKRELGDSGQTPATPLAVPPGSPIGSR